MTKHINIKEKYCLVTMFYGIKLFNFLSVLKQFTYLFLLLFFPTTTRHAPCIAMLHIVRPSHLRPSYCPTSCHNDHFTSVKVYATYIRNTICNVWFSSYQLHLIRTSGISHCYVQQNSYVYIAIVISIKIPSITFNLCKICKIHFLMEHNEESLLIQCFTNENTFISKYINILYIYIFVVLPSTTIQHVMCIVMLYITMPRYMLPRFFCFKKVTILI